MNPDWTNMLAPVTAVFAAEEDANGWMIGTDGNTYFYDDTTFSWSLVSSYNLFFTHLVLPSPLYCTFF
jgi:hypothetical protein